MIAQSWIAQSWIALAAISALIAALHLLRPPARRVALPSMLLWARALAHASRLPAAWRRRLALALALAIAWLLLLALPLPGSLFGTGEATRVALVLDTAPSMAARTRDGRTRFEHARERAARMIDALPATAQVALLDTTASSLPTGFVAPREARAALTRLRPGSPGRAAMPPLPGDAAVHLFTDGVAFDPAAAAATIHSVYEPADNVAITAFDVRTLPQQPTRAHALVQVLNASPGSRHVQLLVRGSDGFRASQALELAGGESVDVTLDVSASRGGVLAAAAALASDAYADDDIAYAVVPAHGGMRVLLVSSGNAALQDALRSLPAVTLSVRAPGRPDPVQAAGEPRYDAYVFDRVAPPVPPPAPALLMRPPAVSWLGEPPEPAAGPGLLRVASAHPAVQGLNWASAPVQALHAVHTATGQSVLLHARGQPAAVAFEAPVRGVVTGFAWSDAPASLQVQLPVFLGNALGWLTGSRDIVRTAPGTIEVALPDAQVSDGNGVAVAARTVGASTVFDGPRPDVFTVRAGTRTLQVAVQPAAPQYAAINRTTLAEAAPGAAVAAAAGPLPGAWLTLALLAAVLLAIDWLLYSRRVTA
ncbi:MAG: hypothetical protein IT532_13430 [Burkholderiales bacterium]|nr:hypothetical protein [Burkholderiales bacterium]